MALPTSRRPAARLAIRIRPAFPEDARRLAALHRASVRAAWRGAYASSKIEAIVRRRPAARYRDAIALGGERFFAAEAGERLAGFGAIRGSELTQLYVHPRFFGRRVGERLLGVLEREAERAGAKRLSLTSALPAAAFYEARGWRRGRRADCCAFDGLRMDGVRMSKRLGSGPSY